MKRMMVLFTGMLLAAGCGGGGDNGTTAPPTAPVASVTLTLSTTTLTPGTTATASALLKDAAGNTLTGRSTTWASSAATIASVDGSGLVTGVGPGTASITATSEGKSGVATITVVLPVASVTVTLSTTTLTPGTTATASAVLKDAAGNTLTGRSTTWASSAATIASVDGSGLVTGVGPGTAAITATSEGKSGLAIITVILPVASVTVTLSTTTLSPGTTATASALLKDAAGNTLTGRSTTWASSAATVASVDGSGLVTGVGPGTAAITATSEGKSGNATITVVLPVATVVINGSSRTKVGDTYTFSATARLADGTVVNRPVTWSIRETTMGVMTPSGSLTPLRPGSITLQATIDGNVWQGTTTAYDWEDLSSGGSLRVGIFSDSPITNKFGTSELPLLVISCTSLGSFFLWVSFDNFVTHNGVVAYSFDGGPISTQTWDELSPSYNTLWYPGTNLAVKTFASRIAGARTFGFAFTEFNASAKAMTFRVNGLGPRLSPILAACPSSSLVVDGSSARMELTRYQSANATVPTEVVAERQMRQLRGPMSSVAPDLSLRPTVLDAQAAVRRPQSRKQ